MPRTSKARQRSEVVWGVGRMELLVEQCETALRRINEGSQQITEDEADALDFYATDLRNISTDLALITSMARTAMRNQRLKMRPMPMRVSGDRRKTVKLRH